MLLLFSLVYHNESTFVGSTPVSVTGEKANSTTLPCQFEPTDILRIDLWRKKSIFSCQNETCENGRFSKKGACDVTIKNLSYSDAGQYTLKVFYNHAQTVLNQIKERIYHLHIHDKISVQEGGELGDLPSAHQVLYQPSGSKKWEKVWSEGQSDLHNFRTNYTGTYKVLDSEENTLITVTVTESGTESKDEHSNTKEDKTEQLPLWAWIVIGVVLALALALAVVVKKFVIKKCQKTVALSVTYHNPSESINLNPNK